jgi:REP element-mobilizing transposase RayT
MNNMGSQAVDVINLLHEDNIYIVYLSSTDNESIKEAADEFYKEETFSKDNIEGYVNYLINICKEKNIEIFIPSRRMDELCKFKDVFIRNNIKMLIPDDINEFIILNDKIKTYELLKYIVPDAIPEHYLVKDWPSFIGATGKLFANNKVACMKYATDIASNSFRILNTNKHTLKELEKKTDKEKSLLSHSINYTDALEMIKDGLEKDLIVMEYMPGEEVSCDCLKTSKGNIIIPRIKINNKIQKICKNELIMEYCDEILNNISYNTPCNIQFKLNENNIPILLEINTRMSGGVMIASWATGINIPLIAVKQLANEDFSFNDDWKDVKMIQRMNYDKIY